MAFRNIVTGQFVKRPVLWQCSTFAHQTGPQGLKNSLHYSAHKVRCIVVDSRLPLPLNPWLGMRFLLCTFASARTGQQDGALQLTPLYRMKGRHSNYATVELARASGMPVEPQIIPVPSALRRHFSSNLSDTRARAFVCGSLRIPCLYAFLSFECLCPQTVACAALVREWNRLGTCKAFGGSGDVIWIQKERGHAPSTQGYC